MPFITADDGAQIFYKDWGTEGSPVILSHGWPLNADAWEAAALYPGQQRPPRHRPRPPRDTAGPRKLGTVTRWTPTPTIWRR